MSTSKEQNREKEKTSLKDKLRHAFAVETEDEELTEDECRLINDIAGKIHSRGLTAAAIPFLEIHKPLNVIGANMVQMGEMIFTTGPVENFLKQFIGKSYSHRVFVSTIEKRKSIELLISRLEELDNQ